VPRNFLFASLLLPAIACAPLAARAEVTLGAVSDHRYRGVALGDGSPALQAGIVLDRDSGWYAGVFGSTTRIEGRRGLQVVSYAGHAWRLQDGRSWEAGIQYVAFTSHHDEDYRELYLGLASDRWNLRAHYQPEALGSYGPAAYLDLGASLPMGDRFVLLGHAGAGWRGGRLDPGVDRTYFDARLGIGLRLGAYSLYVQRVATWREGGYLSGHLPADADAAGWVLGITRAW
jgi:uncharacterized protein (TIGR02001 family)